jgi:fido (protein-threonine AMPylation protein)
VVLDTTYWIAHKSFLLPEIAVRFHHRLVFVHPFPNGNGRHARIAADLLLEFHGQPALTWGRNVRVAPDMVRSAYISALKKADGGQYDDLVKFAQS